jgi:hypothetical protein
MGRNKASDGDGHSRVYQGIETHLISAIHSPQLVFRTVIRCSCSNLIPGDDNPGGDKEIA